MSDETLDLEAIQARADAATEGLWANHGNGVHTSRGECVALTHRTERYADAEFIAAARTDVPALAAEVRSLRTQRDEAYSKGFEQVRRRCEVAESRVDALAAQLEAVRELRDQWQNWPGPGRAPVPWIAFFGRLDAALAAAVPVQPADERCSRCGHAYHEKPCLNMASDNDCSCPSSPAVQPVNDETDKQR